MTRREAPKARMLAALTGKAPGALPAAPAYPSLFLADFAQAYYVEQYRLRTRGLVRYPVDHEEDTRFRARALYQSYGVFKSRPDWIEVDRGASRSWAERTEIVVVDGVPHYEDKELGVRLPMEDVPLQRGDAGLVPANPSLEDLWDTSNDLQTAEQVDESLPIPTARELLARGDMDLARQVVADYGDEYFIETVLGTPFSDAYSLLGFQGLMVIQHDRPEIFHHLLARMLSQMMEVMAAWAAAGVHGVFVEECFAGADLISPRSYEEFVFEYDVPFFRALRSLGLLPILYVCGDAIPRIERMVQLDIAAVAVEESKKNFSIEIEDVVERVDGRAAVFGNIDSVRFGIHATMDEMEAEVKRQANIGTRANGFIVGTGSPFPLDTNPRQIDTLVETAHSLAG